MIETDFLSKSRAAAESGDLAAAEKLLEQALHLAPDDARALSEAARFYDSVAKDPVRAREYASRARAAAAMIVSEMDNILGTAPGAEKPLASRHIGGIIGPY